MANILDYLEWRGDLTLAQDPFNPVDGLILCRLAYVPFDGIAPSPGAGTVTIGEAAKTLLAQDTPERRAAVESLWKGDAELLAALAASGRFADMLLEGYVSELDPDEEKQFSAFTVRLGTARAMWPTGAPTARWWAGKRISTWLSPRRCPPSGGL